MVDLIKIEFYRCKRFILFFPLMVLILLGLELRSAVPITAKWFVVNTWILVLVFYVFGAWQAKSVRGSNDWFRLIHRPVSCHTIGIANLSIGLCTVFCSTIIPMLIVLCVLRSIDTRLVEAGLYSLVLSSFLTCACFYLIGHMNFTQRRAWAYSLLPALLVINIFASYEPLLLAFVFAICALLALSSFKAIPEECLSTNLIKFLCWLISTASIFLILGILLLPSKASSGKNAVDEFSFTQGLQFEDEQSKALFASHFNLNNDELFRHSNRHVGLLPRQANYERDRGPAASTFNQELGRFILADSIYKIQELDVFNEKKQFDKAPFMVKYRSDLYADKSVVYQYNPKQKIFTPVLTLSETDEIVDAGIIKDKYFVMTTHNHVYLYQINPNTGDFNVDLKYQVTLPRYDSMIQALTFAENPAGLLLDLSYRDNKRIVLQVSADRTQSQIAVGKVQSSQVSTFLPNQFFVISSPLTLVTVDSFTNLFCVQACAPEHKEARNVCLIMLGLALFSAVGAWFSIRNKKYSRLEKFSLCLFAFVGNIPSLFALGLMEWDWLSWDRNLKDVMLSKLR